MKRTRIVMLAAVVIALGLGFQPPAQAKKTHKGKIQLFQAPAWVGLIGEGQDTLTGMAFHRACQADRIALLAGQKAQATNIDRFLTSPFNGLDGWVVDLKDPVMGGFQVKGPGAKDVVSPVTEYDLDMDFFTTIDLNLSPDHTFCNSANTGPTQGHKCAAHDPEPDEKNSCISGYKDLKGKVHGARYVLVTAGLNLKGPMDITLTTP